MSKRLTAETIEKVLERMNPTVFGKTREAQTPISHDIYASMVTGKANTEGKTKLTIVQSTNPNPRARKANVLVSPYIRALVKPMNDVVVEARADGKQVPVLTGIKRSKANNIFKNDQTRLFWLCSDTFNKGKTTDENPSGTHWNII